jgi:broad specificity phosphatase PhoE
MVSNMVRDLVLAIAGAVLGGALVAVLGWYWLVNNITLLEKISNRGKQQRRPKRLILVRHGQSVGNQNKALYASVPDNKIPLTALGQEQSEKAGEELKELIGDESVEWFVSPYVRTAQTFMGIVRAFGYGSNNLPTGLRMSPQIREQDFGNFQDPDEMRQNMEDRMRFGRFWYRFPGGESGADVYDRVDSFIAHLFRAMDKSHPGGREGSKPTENYVLVTHGLTMRLICMRYLHWSIETFEQVWNPGNCEVWVFEKTEAGWYKLISPIAYGEHKHRRILPQGMQQLSASRGFQVLSVL